MLKKRIIPILLLNGNRLWKSRQFMNHRDVGSPKTAAKIYEAQESDEIMLLNIGQEAASFSNLLKYTHIISQECCVPLCAGGNIRDFTQAQDLFKHGADKIMINSANYKNKSLLKKVADVYGAQSVVVGIDVRFNNDTKSYQLFSEAGKDLQNIPLERHIQECVENGAGEFLIQAIDHEGMMQGLDLKLGKLVKSMTKRPVVLTGGAGSYTHIESAFKDISVSGIACASIFHFTDSNPLRANAHMANAGISVKKV